MVEFNTILSFIQAGGIIVGVSYYIMNIQNQQKNQELTLESQKQSTDTREAQLYMQLYMRITSEEFMKRSITLINIQFDTVEEFLDQYSSDLDMQSKWISLMWHIDGLGYLMHEGYVNPEVVYNFGQGSGQLAHWLKWEPVILEMRKRRGNFQFLMWFEYLVNEMSKLRVEKGLSPNP